MARQTHIARQPVTVRLPFDEYREAVRRARGREWSLSAWVGWCVRQQLTRGPQSRNQNALVGVVEPIEHMYEDDDAGRR